MTETPPPPAQPAPPAEEGPLTEWLLRAFALLVFGVAVRGLLGAWWADTSRWTLLFLLISEGFTLLLVLVARRATARDMSPLAVIATAYAMFFFVLFEPQGTHRLLPELAGAGLQIAGIAWQLTSKAALGRSFGLLPAQRVVVISGPYRLVRHPIYFGYLITHIGFLLTNASWRNAAVLALLYAAQVHRIQQEEAILSRDEHYQHYRRKVRWRLVPGLY